jgi:hypothetical protein
VTPSKGLDAGAKRAQNSAEADSKQSDAAHDRIADTTDGGLTHGTPAIILPEDMDALLEVLYPLCYLLECVHRKG